MALTLIKNIKGRVVSTTPERKKYLLDPKPVARKVNGQPKEDNNGNQIYLKKAFHEQGWTEPTKEEVAAFMAEQEAGEEAAQDAENATQAALIATKSAAQLSAQAGNIKPKAQVGRKSNAQKEMEEKEAAEATAKAQADMEAKVRDAEGDKAKYDALSDDEKEMYATLGLEAVTA